MKLIISEEINKKFKLTHCTNAPKTLLARRFKKYARWDTRKPNGLWLSIDGEWEKWCKAEDFHIRKSVLKALLKPDLTFIYLDSKKSFKQWVNESQGLKWPDFYTTKPRNKYETGWDVSNLWEWCYKQYDGICLTEEGQCQTRMHTFMYGWDVASVVVFKPSNVLFYASGGKI